jgi:alkanesulfonate monooxygenase SsuD/methylene tetrahydromethanopterin reductase-like flavin-dependent oxidoreductase (luciferase family)
MKFGIFDHLDRYGTSLKDYYDDRLRLIEEYDRAGFYAYHVAEHHSTSLGMAPSPSVFLSSVAQRTRRLRFGPMVYALPMYHPLRLIEEICMLDHLSGGRLELGFGRGSSPVELEYYGQAPDKAESVYAEAIQIIRQGLTGKLVDFEGEHFCLRQVPMELETLQKPMPPIWYGTHSPASAERAALKGFNIMGLSGPGDLALAFERFRVTWQQARPDSALPLMGLGRFIVVADNDRTAMEIGRRAYKRWHHSFTYLAQLHRRAQRIPRPETFEELIEAGQGVAGSPATVSARLAQQLQQTGSNYLVGQFAFGDLSLAETLSSLKLFVDEVMPGLQDGDAPRAQHLQAERSTA